MICVFVLRIRVVVCGCAVPAVSMSVLCVLEEIGLSDLPDPTGTGGRVESGGVRSYVLSRAGSRHCCCV
jgi:hypothetical protein